MPGLPVMGREIVGPGKSFDLNPMAVTIDVRPLGLTGYQASEWLRANCHVDIGSADDCRIGARLSYADDDKSERRLVESLQALVDAADPTEKSPPLQLRPPCALGLKSAS